MPENILLLYLAISRRRLTEMVKRFGLGDRRVLAQSRRLDRLVVAAMRRGITL